MNSRFLGFLHSTQENYSGLRILVMLMFNFVFANCTRFLNTLTAKCFKFCIFKRGRLTFQFSLLVKKHFDCIVAWLSCPSHCHHQIYNCCTTIELKKLFLKLTLMNTWNCQNVEWLFWWKLESHLFSIVIFQACRVQGAFRKIIQLEYSFTIKSNFA